MAERIYISKADVDQLQALIDHHASGRDGGAAERLRYVLGGPSGR